MSKLALLEALVHEHPRRATEGWLDYCDRLCVLAGLLKPGAGRLPEDYDFKGEPVRVPVGTGARLPYKDPE